MRIDHDFLGDFPPVLNNRLIGPVKGIQHRKPEELSITRLSLLSLSSYLTRRWLLGWSSDHFSRTVPCRRSRRSEARVKANQSRRAYTVSSEDVSQPEPHEAAALVGNPVCVKARRSMDRDSLHLALRLGFLR
jgi:hypothetical protein